jgi:capsular polysaccharide export protein
LEAGQLDHAHRWLLQSRPNFVVGEVPAFSAELQFIQLSQGKIGAAHDQYTTRGQVAILAKMVGEERYPLPFTPSRAHQKTLLIAEGGPGDEIRFASMYSEIEAGIEDLTVTCDPRLHTILRRSFPKIHFLPVRRYRRELYSDFVHNVFEERRRVRDPGLAMIIDDAVLDRVEEFQRVAYVMDYLPVLRRDYVDFRRLGQYLQTSPEAGSVWNERRREMFGDRVVVGLSWRSVLRSAARRRHYTEIGDWKRLFEDPRLALVCLQSRVTDDEREIVHRNGWELTIFDDVDQHNDFEATGPLMQSLDWVVAPCTTTLEFAGALGVRSILFSGSEQLTWRQLPDGSDVWHPSVTVELSHREKHSALEARSVADRVHAIIAANT